MKRMGRIVILFGMFMLLSACHSHKTALTDQNGHVVDLKTHPQKWLVINYWAPWCEPCKHELPEINQFYLTHRDTVDVYGFDYDHPSRERLVELAKTMGLDYPLLAQDPSKQLHLGDIQGLPVTFIFNPQGTLVKTLVGPQTGADLSAVIQAN